MTMDPLVARKTWRTLESYFAMIFFVPEAPQAYERIGLEPQVMGYFASRAACLGPVPAEVVVATFYNFNPAVVHAVIPTAWERATPAQILAARREGVDAALRRMLGDGVDSPDLREALGLARTAAEACTAQGRPLYAGHAALDWPEAPHLALWHAIGLLREYRGDGHVAALLLDGTDGCEALVMHAASGETSAKGLKMTRGWSDEAWQAAVDRLTGRGWLAADGSLTDEGRRHRQWVEDATDRLAIGPWAHLGEEGCTRLRALVRPLSAAIIEAGTFPRGLSRPQEA